MMFDSIDYAGIERSILGRGLATGSIKQIYGAMSAEKVRRPEWKAGEVCRYEGKLCRIIHLNSSFFPTTNNDMGYPTNALLEELDTGDRIRRSLFQLERVPPLEALAEQAE